MKIIQLALALAGLALSASAERQRGIRGAAGEAKESFPFRGLQEEKAGGDINIEDIIGVGCFSEVATAQVQNRGPVLIKDLQHGDRVLTASNDYQPVYSFGHYNLHKKALFRQVQTQDTVLELTDEHLVYLKDQVHPVRADSLEVGDALLGIEGKGQIITKISTVQRQGLYTPFTPDGTVVVDGIVASSYISLQDGQHFLEMKNGLRLPLSHHDYIHMGMSPMRLLCMGVSASFCKNNLNQDGLPSYAAWSIDMSLWTNSLSLPVQALILVVFLLFFVPCLAAETLFGPSLAPLALFGLASLYLWRRRVSSGKQKSL